jgi:hypothetical protein
MGDAPRRFLRFRLRTLFWLTLLLAVTLSAYSYWSEYAEQAAQRQRELMAPAPGAMCAVVLRADLVGLERMHPGPAETNGVVNYVRGKFVAMNQGWIKLEGATPGDPQRWIPRENVLLIEARDP